MDDKDKVSRVLLYCYSILNTIGGAVYSEDAKLVAKYIADVLEG